jgi:hypothetical protein
MTSCPYGCHEQEDADSGCADCGRLECGYCPGCFEPDCDPRPFCACDRDGRSDR